MAGGEFCGNATRSAAYIFLNGKTGKIKVKVNSKDIINAGVTDSHHAWCEIPIIKSKEAIIKKEKGIYIVTLNGITIIVIKPEQSEKYLNNKNKLKDYSIKFIEKYNLKSNEAVGVMYTERIENSIKMHPIVWVKSINTLFYETACGSGTTATCMVEAYEKKQSQIIDVIQPTGCIITGNIKYENNLITSAIISGEINYKSKKQKLTI